jgi:large subunit ribosomal protein L24
MQKKFKIKSGDTVFVLAGKDKGKTGEIMKVDREKERVIVKGVNIQKKHQKPSQGNPGGLIDKEGFIHISNVNFLDKEKNKPTRLGIQKTSDGKKVRVSKRSKKVIDEK